MKAHVFLKNCGRLCNGIDGAAIDAERRAVVIGASISSVDPEGLQPGALEIIAYISISYMGSSGVMAGVAGDLVKAVRAIYIMRMRISINLDKTSGRIEPAGYLAPEARQRRAGDRAEMKP